MKNIFDEIMETRLKVERDGKEIINIPGILALPGALIAPKASVIGTVAASLLGCKIRLESEEGKGLDVGEKIRDAADTVADVAREAVKTVKEEVSKAWDEISADDPEEEAPEAKKAEDAEAPAETPAEEEIPVIRVNPEDRK